MTFWESFANLCAKAGKKPNPVGKELGVSSGTITLWKKGTLPNGEKLIQIADYFGVSVDYLLGRETLTGNSIGNANTDDNVIQQVNSSNSVISSTNPKEESKFNENIVEPFDEMTEELVKGFRCLKFRDKMEVMNLILEKQKKSA